MAVNIAEIEQGIRSELDTTVAEQVVGKLTFLLNETQAKILELQVDVATLEAEIAARNPRPQEGITAESTPEEVQAPQLEENGNPINQ